MWKNNLIIAWRTILKNKLQTGINIAGLALGICGCLIVFLITEYELGFNKSIANADRIYRVNSHFSGAFTSLNPGVPKAFPTVGKDLTGVEVYSNFFTYYADIEIPAENERIPVKEFKDEEDIIIAGPEYFDLIQNYEWLVGSPRQSLEEPSLVVLTEEKAKTYFGLKDPVEAVGRTMIYNDSLALTVSGILKEPKFRSDFHFTEFISYSTIKSTWLNEEYELSNWSNVSSNTQFFLKIAEHTQASQVQEQLDRISQEQRSKEENTDWVIDYKLQALSDLHFNAEMGTFDAGPSTAHKSTLYGLGLVALLLLLIAAINFINLATVQATKRAKEVGIRKVIGGTKGQLSMQFLVETFLLAVIAVPAALMLTEFAFRYFGDILPEGLTFAVSSPLLMLFIIVLVVLITLLSGLYPAFVLSSHRPAFALKNILDRSSNSNRVGLRKALIIFQFTLAQVFIIGALIMQQQLSFTLNKDLGFNRDQIVHFNFGRVEESKKDVIKERLEQMPDVNATSLQYGTPIRRGWNTSVVKYGEGDELKKYEAHMRYADTAYLNLYDIPLVAGRNYVPSDTISELLINETFAQQLGFENPNDALGEAVSLSGDLHPVVGVLKDFHLQSFHKAIEPIIITTRKSSTFGIGVQFGGNESLADNIKEVKAIWAGILPDQTFNYYILDETVASLYATEQRHAKLVNLATGVAIFLSCLGLFGLAFFTVTLRTKEIGIRKILGASIASIVNMLSMDFVKLILISLVIAIPVSWYFMSQWLQGFAYNVGIQWWVFLVAGFLVLLIALATMSVQSVKAALANPVEALRNE